jgi:hypothetical protein
VSKPLAQTSSRSVAPQGLEGPKGVGALYVRHGTHILAQQHGRTPGAPPAGRDGRNRGRRRRAWAAAYRG